MLYLFCNPPFICISTVFSTRPVLDPFRVVMGSPFDKSDKFLLQFFLPAGSLKVVNAPEVVHNVTGLPKIHLFDAKKKRVRIHLHLSFLIEAIPLGVNYAF